MTVYVSEWYRPREENDEMLMFVDNINYVTEKIDEIEYNYTYYYKEGDKRHKIIVNGMNMADLPKFINDFVFHHQILQPCNLSIHVLEIFNIKCLGIVIREILEHNLNSI